MAVDNIPNKPILEFLYQRFLDDKIWCTWFQGYENSIDQAMPVWVDEDMIQAKMSELIKKGFVSGCDCGCRGDYEITSAGMDYLATLDQ
jgi:hypothetical protein